MGFVLVGLIVFISQGRKNGSSRKTTCCLSLKIHIHSIPRTCGRKKALTPQKCWLPKVFSMCVHTNANGYTHTHTLLINHLLKLALGIDCGCYVMGASRTKIVSTCGLLSIYRHDWDPPDRKVDTRKFRSEPRSIFEYEPGKSSILQHERPVSTCHWSKKPAR